MSLEFGPSTTYFPCLGDPNDLSIGRIHKSYFNYSYSRNHFSQLPQSVDKALINSLPRKVSYVSILIDPVINGFSPNELKFYLHIFYHSIVTFVIGGLCLGFSNTSHVDSLDKFRKSVVDKVKFDIRIFFRIIILKKKF